MFTPLFAYQPPREVGTNNNESAFQQKWPCEKSTLEGTD